MKTACFLACLTTSTIAWGGIFDSPYLTTPYTLATQVMDPEEPMVPAELVDSIREDLELINLVFPGASSWRARAPFVPGYMVLYLTTEGVERWESGTFSELEAILEQYDGEVTDFRKWESFGGGYVDIDFAEPLNTPLLFPFFEELSGVDYPSVNGFIGDGDRAFYVPETGLYIFRHGYGDCPSGCIHQEVDYFRVADDEVTRLTREQAQALSGFSINPAPETVTIDTHEPVEIGNGFEAPRSLAHAYVQWVRSETADFVEYSRAGYGDPMEIPFARLSDAGYYKATYSIRATGFSFVGPVIQLKVTDTEPTDPEAVAIIEDPGLRDYILDQLQIPALPIGRNELTSLWQISLDTTWIPGPVKSLEGLQYMTGLTSFKTGRNAVTDLSPLSSLTELDFLSLGAQGRTERLELSLVPLHGLPALRSLKLNYYSISDLDVLSSLPELDNLDLINCGISSIDNLTTLDLRGLSLNWNPVTDISPLLDFPNLQSVDLEGTPIDFSEDSPDRPVLDALREQGVYILPTEARLPRLWSTETWIPAAGGRGFFWMRPGIAHNQVYENADWLTMLGDGNSYEKVRFEVEANPDPEPRSVRLVVHNLAHVVHQLGNSGPWRNAIPVGEDGWRRSDWLGFFLPGEADWIWHPEHGWLKVAGASIDDLWLYDVAQNCWMWTSANAYPFLYRNNDEPTWLFYIEGALPGERWFYDMTTRTYVQEG